MAETQTAEARFTMICLRCERPVLARHSWIGRDVQCPHCSGVLRVPAAPTDGRPVRADAPSMGANRNFNFACGRCDALLEAHTGMCGQKAFCPTCAAEFRVPHLNPRNGMPLGPAEVADDGELPTPLHAYAASGQQAPKIENRGGVMVIECARCGADNTIDANVCKGCGVPFVIEAAATAGDADSNGRALASIVLGVLGLASWAGWFFAVPGMLAIVFGAKSAQRAGNTRRSSLALVGIGLGVLSLCLPVIRRALGL